MEARAPYRIYDPGGASVEMVKGLGEQTQPPPTSYQQLVAENNILKERMKGLKSLGNLLEESQCEASKLKQKVEELVRQEGLRSTILPHEVPNAMESTGGSVQESIQHPSHGSDPGNSTGNKPEEKPASAGTSSEFEVVSSINKIEMQGEDERDVLQQTPTEDGDLSVHLQRLETSLSVVAEETHKKHLLAHLGRMAVEFNRLSSKVQKNECRTAILQTLCKQLQTENEDLRTKLDQDLDLKSQMLATMKCENVRLKGLVAKEKLGLQQAAASEVVSRPTPTEQTVAGPHLHQGLKVGDLQKLPDKNMVEILEKKVAALEMQRKELLEVNKQWDQQFRGMKQQYEQKIVGLRQRVAGVRREVTERDTASEQRQRDFDRKLLLAKSRLDSGETERERYLEEIRGLRQDNEGLREQLAPVTRQRECQEREIQRLNKALEEAIARHSPLPVQRVLGGVPDPCLNARRDELLTQIEVLKQQVKIFEEDFQRERSDRERMSEEKEELQKQLDKLHTQMGVLNTQLQVCQEDYQKEKLERETLQNLLKNQKQGLGERRASDPPPGAPRIYCPPYQLPYPHLAHPAPVYGPYDVQIHYPPSPMPPGQAPFPPPDYAWNAPYPPGRGQPPTVPERPQADGKAELVCPAHPKGQH